MPVKTIPPVPAEPGSQSQQVLVRVAEHVSRGIIPAQARHELADVDALTAVRKPRYSKHLASDDHNAHLNSWHVIDGDTDRAAYRNGVRLEWLFEADADRIIAELNAADALAVTAGNGGTR